MPATCWVLAAGLPVVVLATEVLFPLFVGALGAPLGADVWRAMAGYVVAAGAVFGLQAAALYGLCRWAEGEPSMAAALAVWLVSGVACSHALQSVHRWAGNA